MPSYSEGYKAALDDVWEALQLEDLRLSTYGKLEAILNKLEEEYLVRKGELSR